MAVPVPAPRVNNNDDTVRLAGLEVAAGDRVERGQVVALVETDKAIVEVAAPAEGYVLHIAAEADTQIAVGSTLMWLGARPDEPIPLASPAAPTTSTARTPTAKARQLLRQYGLDADTVPGAGSRLTVEDVQRHAAALGLAPPPAQIHATTVHPAEAMPAEPGVWRDLSGDEQGMVATVAWHRDHAVPGYLELGYDPEPWAACARTFAERHKLLLSPLLPLMAWRLAQLAADTPKLNSTLIGGRRYEYAAVHLGFTVQVGETLYLCVQRDAATLDALAFAHALGGLQRRAAARQLGAAETQGATLGFSSMERWKVGRHIPVLAPHTALMVAHTIDAQGRGVLGATYDHRVLNGFQVAAALRKLAVPPAELP